MRDRIAIIGAGISGLTVARNLGRYADVIVYEKARGVGGRMSTRYADPFYFDHGVQSFTVLGKEFNSFLEPFFKAGFVNEWCGKTIRLEEGKEKIEHQWVEPYFVGSPNMNSLCKKMAEGLDVRLMTEVGTLAPKESDAWDLKDKDGNSLGKFDWVICTAPAQQTVNLLRVALPEVSSIHNARMEGCYALMIGFNRPWDQDWIASEVLNNPIKSISINSTKPRRNSEITSIVVHSCKEWADTHMDDDVQIAQAYLLGQLEAVTGIPAQTADYISTHRWKYATVKNAQNLGFYCNSQQKIASTGDWSSGSNIEDVWLSAKKLADEITTLL